MIAAVHLAPESMLDRPRASERRRRSAGSTSACMAMSASSVPSGTAAEDPATFAGEPVPSTENCAPAAALRGPAERSGTEVDLASTRMNEAHPWSRHSSAAMVKGP